MDIKKIRKIYGEFMRRKPKASGNEIPADVITKPRKKEQNKG